MQCSERTGYRNGRCADQRFNAATVFEFDRFDDRCGACRQPNPRNQDIAVDSDRHMASFPDGYEGTAGQRTDTWLRVDRAHRGSNGAVNSISTEIGDFGGRVRREPRGCRQGDSVSSGGHIGSGRFGSLFGSFPFAQK